MEGTKVNLRYEVSEGTNLGWLAERAQRFSSDAAAKKRGVNARERTRAASQRFVIETLHSDGAVIYLSSNLVPLAKLDVNIEPFVLENLSQDNPVTTGELSVLFLQGLLAEAGSVTGMLKPVFTMVRKELTRDMPSE